MARKRKLAAQDLQVVQSSICELSLDELTALITGMRVLFVRRQAAYRRLLYGQMQSLAQAAGFESVEAFIADQNGKRPKSKKGGKTPPKYRNPLNSRQTWCGLGRRPIWVQKHLAGSSRLEELEIG